MKKLLLFAMLFITIAASGQIRLGYTPSEIKYEFSKYTFENDVADDGTTMLLMKTNYAYIYYYFVDNVCVQTVIFPKNDYVVQNFVQIFNESYVIVDDTEWKYYSNGKIMNVTLKYFDKEDQFAFVAYII